jgi:hypothetical protein
MLIAGLVFGLSRGEIFATEVISEGRSSAFSKNWRRVQEQSFCVGKVPLGEIYKQTIIFITNPANRVHLDRSITDVIRMAMREKWPGPGPCQLP